MLEAGILSTPLLLYETTIPSFFIVLHFFRVRRYMK
jgi:hypothetical protein